MGIKIAHMFQFGNTGWSETFYRDIALSAFNIDTYASSLYTLRRPLLSPQVSIVGVRASDLDNPRQVKIKRVNWAGNFSPGVLTPGTDQVDQPFVAVLCAMGSSNGFRRVIYLRGVPDLVTDTRYRVIIDAPWVGKFNAFATWITGGTFSCYTQKPSDNPPNNISNITVVANKIRITAYGHGFSTSETVRISKLVSSPVLNGIWKMRKIDDDNFDLVGSDTALNAIPFDFGGIVKSQRRTLDTIISMGQVKTTSHKVGRPFDLPRSRRRKATPKLPASLAGSYSIS